MHIALLLLGSGHLAEGVDGHTAAAGITDIQVPVHHGHGGAALEDAESGLLGLLEGEVHGGHIAVHGGVELEKEAVGAGVGAALEVLGKPDGGLSVGPSLLQSPAFRASMRVIIISVKWSTARSAAEGWDSLLPVARRFL
jgi:hypothetical protein